ncbi:hypothetical protein CsSME_00027203 [Camellia sinensis var. sinensis]
MKAIIAGVNQDDLIPQVFLQDELSTLAKKAFNLLQPRWSDIVEYEETFRIASSRARNQVSALYPVKNMLEGVDRLNIPSSVAELYTSDAGLSVAENPEKFTILALATGSNVTLLADQVLTGIGSMVDLSDEIISCGAIS